MPTYDYECPACGYQFELFQNMTEKHLSVCPQCKSIKLKRLIGCGAGIIFKGSGFYETDYKRRDPAYKKESKGKSESLEKSDKEKTSIDPIKKAEAPKTISNSKEPKKAEK